MKRAARGGARGNNKKPHYSKKLEKENIDFDITSDEDDISDNDAANISDNGNESDSDEHKETAEESRLRIAKEYLSKIKEEEEALRSDSDEEDTDDLVEKRLQSDAVEKRGQTMRTFNDRLTDSSFSDCTFYKGHHLSPTCICLSGDDRYMFTGSKDCDIIQWDVESGKKVTTFKGKRQTLSNAKELETFKGHKGDIYSIDVTYDGHLLASGGKDKYVRVFDIREGNTQTEEFKGHNGSIYTVKFKPNSYTLYTGSEDRTIRSWNLTDMAYIETLFGHQSAVTSIDCLQDDRIITAGTDNTIRLWKIIDETQLIYRGLTDMISQESVVAMYNNLYISGSQNGDICLWSNMKKKPINVYNNIFDNNKWIVSMASVFNSDLFALGAASEGIRIYTLKENKREIELKYTTKHAGFINGLCFSKEARFICAAIGQEHRLGRWWRDANTQNGVLIQPIKLSE